MPSALIFLDAAAIVGLLCIVKYFLPKPNVLLPPGPRPLPVVGNMLDMPVDHAEHVFAQWREKWGNMIYLNIFGQSIVVLNSFKDALCIFEKQGSKSSDRPKLTMCSEILGWDQTLVLNPYGERWRIGRKMFHQYLGGRGQLSTVIAKFSDIQERETRASLKRILRDPGNVEDHIRTTAGAVILDITYGYRVKEGRDAYVTLIERAIEGFNSSLISGRYLVDIIPVLKYVPSWMPGAGWKRQAKRWRALTEAAIHRPYEFAKDAMGKGTATESFVTVNQENVTNNEQEQILKTAAASMYGGGADTSVSSVYSFILAMTLYPEVQKKAQEELDRVVGNDRLPSFGDMDHLPYIRALVSEVLRWMPVAPLLTRRSIEDIEHNGYIIPAGTVFVTNIWLFLHDPDVYSEPDVFKPERYLKTETHEPEQDPRSASFGFGRRNCPGMNLAEASIFIQCAMYLAVFNISKATVNGIEVTPVAESVPGAISHPKHFLFSIKPRSVQAEALILAAH